MEYVRRETPCLYNPYDVNVSCSTLCWRCSAIPWATLFREPEHSRIEMFDMTNPAEELQCSSCPCCRIFCPYLWDLNTPILKVAYRDGSIEYTDTSGKSWISSSLTLRWNDNGSLHENLGHYMAGRSPKSFSSTPHHIDFMRTESWIQTCMSEHEHCEPQPSNTLSNLKVLDCYNRTVVLAPVSCLFVALSYVWGPPAPHPEPMDVPKFPALPCVLPRTVEDSIRATKMLGYKYLWVDRYVRCPCIIHYMIADQTVY
jgi:hypothetical protein